VSGSPARPTTTRAAGATTAGQGGTISAMRGAPSAAGPTAVFEKTVVHPEETILDYCGNIGTDVVIECSGSEAAVNLALGVIKKGGLYTQMGLSGRPISVDINEVTMKEIEYRGTFATKWQAYEDAIRLIAGGKVRLGSLITDVLPLDRWEEAFRKSIEGIGIKYIFKPGL